MEKTKKITLPPIRTPLSPSSVAKYLNVSRESVVRKMNHNQILSTVINKRGDRVVKASDLLVYLQNFNPKKKLVYSKVCRLKTCKQNTTKQ